LFQRWLGFREALLKASGVQEETGAQTYSDREMVLDVVREQARQLEEEQGEGVASRFFGMATGAATFLQEVCGRWLDETGPPPKRRTWWPFGASWIGPARPSRSKRSRAPRQGLTFRIC